jgi:hypothetical protein
VTDNLEDVSQLEKKVYLPLTTSETMQRVFEITTRLNSPWQPISPLLQACPVCLSTVSYAYGHEAGHRQWHIDEASR